MTGRQEDSCFQLVSQWAKCYMLLQQLQSITEVLGMSLQLQVIWLVVRLAICPGAVGKVQVPLGPFVTARVKSQSGSGVTSVPINNVMTL